jgi:hypothetical protein
MRHRRATAVGFVIVTAIFAMGIRNVQIQTILSDPLPEDDPFVQVYKDHPNFGNPLTVTLMLVARSFSICARCCPSPWCRTTGAANRTARSTALMLYTMCQENPSWMVRTRIGHGPIFPYSRIRYSNGPDDPPGAGSLHHRRAHHECQ